jgi:putative hemolysin
MDNKNSSISDKSNLIDIEKAFNVKNPSLYKIIPAFIFKKLKKLIHQDELNEIINTYSDKTGLDFSKKGLDHMGVKTKSIGEHNIPKSGGIIIVANHPLGGLDGVAIINEVGKVRSDVHILVNDILLQIKNFKPIFVPINKHGKNSRTNLSYIDNLYASNKCIILFPAGMVSRRQQHKKIEDLEWKKSFITKSIKHKRDVIPAYVNGENSKRFYNIAYWRKKIGIKANIEMLFLADEMFKQKGNTIIFKFGTPIPWHTFNKKIDNLKWAQKVKKFVYTLKHNEHNIFSEKN